MLRSAPPPPEFQEFPPGEVDRSIPDRFRLVVERFPERVSVQDGVELWTYRRLDAGSNRVARALRSEAPPGTDPIASLMGHGALSIVGMVGALKAGRPWVPLSITDPAQRLRGILQRAGIREIVSDQVGEAKARAAAPEGVAVHRIEPWIESGNSEDPCYPIAPDLPCLVIFTSGSTGVPKGVVHSHRTILQNTLVHTNTLKIVPEDRFSQAANPSTLASVSPVFRAILNGGCVLPFDASARGAAELGRWLDRERITVCQLVPTLFRLMVENLTAAEKFSKMRVVHLGGEGVFRSDVLEFRKRFPRSCVLLHNLGATEATTIRQYFLDHDTPLFEDRIPVGYEVPGREVWVVGDDGQPAPTGEIGEIVVRSRFLALGYWRNPDETSKVFRPDPAGGGMRRFHTGDLGILKPNGCLLHLGRRDDQVKVHGYRVELSEIDAALNSLEGVRQGAAAARCEAGGVLVTAYVVPRLGTSVKEDAIRCTLKRLLPRHMVPSRIVFRESLPLTSSGKVDRKALCDSEPVPAPAVPVRGGIEDTLVALCAEVLGRPVLPEDNLLELGCDSVQMARIQTRIALSFGVEIPFVRIAGEPRVVDLARAIRELQPP